MRLAKAGVFGSLGSNRRHALWDALAQDQRPMPLFDAAERTGNRRLVPSRLHPPDFLPAMTPAEEVLADYRTTGLSLLAHPLQFLRGELEKLRVIPASGLKTWPDGKWVRVAGLVLVRQRPSTAKGITFVTLEDETATANLIIRPAVWKRLPRRGPRRYDPHRRRSFAAAGREHPRPRRQAGGFFRSSRRHAVAIAGLLLTALTHSLQFCYTVSPRPFHNG